MSALGSWAFIDWPRTWPRIIGITSSENWSEKRWVTNRSSSREGPFGPIRPQTELVERGNSDTQFGESNIWATPKAIPKQIPPWMNLLVISPRRPASGLRMSQPETLMLVSSVPYSSSIISPVSCIP